MKAGEFAMVQRGMTWEIGSGSESNVQIPAAWQGI